MNWLLYIGGFPLFAFIVCRIIGVSAKFDDCKEVRILMGILFISVALSSLLVWTWLCCKIG